MKRINTADSLHVRSPYIWPLLKLFLFVHISTPTNFLFLLSLTKTKTNQTKEHPPNPRHNKADNLWHGLLWEQTLCIYNSGKVKSSELSRTCCMTCNLHLTSAFSVKWRWVLPPIELKYIHFQSVSDLKRCLLKFSMGRASPAHLFHIKS